MVRPRPQYARGKGADAHAVGRKADRRTAVAIKAEPRRAVETIGRRIGARCADAHARGAALAADGQGGIGKARSEEHTSELQSLMRISYAVFCLKKKNKNIIREK